MHLGLVINLVALGIVVGWLASRLWPATEAVRVRNSFLIDPAAPGDFDWTGEHFPRDFRVEYRQPDAFFVAVVKAVAPNDAEASWTRALQLAAHLAENAEDKGPVQSDLVKSYQAIREGFGYCADFVKVYIALAHAANLPVRQWAFSFDGFGGRGHTVVEVWDRERRKWLLLDVHNNVHLVDAATGEPLSAFECREFLLDNRGPVAIRPNGPGREGFRHHDKLISYFRRGVNEWYLWWGNAIYSYFAHPAVRLLEPVSEGAAHLGAFVSGALPHFRVLPLIENVEQVAGMFRLRKWVCAAVAAVVILSVLLGLQIARDLAR